MPGINFRSIILSVLEADERIWFQNEEGEKELNQTLLLDLVEKIDYKIINLLLQEEVLREKFFAKISTNPPRQAKPATPQEGNILYVFKMNDFRFFMEENKIDNSYTAYKNRIGLTDGKKFLKDSNDIVLNWPYKDCILEGGQSNEEGTDNYFEYSEKTEQYEQKQSKRKEIFFNSVLAPDEIDRLLDPKALVNWKRFTDNGEVSLTQKHSTPSPTVPPLKRGIDGTIAENMIIKGNNLLAMHSLKKQFAGKVKLIYIDPPYNTGNDGFKYNDNFNHSTWLTFMKNRLEVARELLRDDGVIFVQCDDNEGAYLKVLMDELFGRENFVNQISWLRSSSGKTISRNLPNDVDIIFWYGKTLDYTYNPVYKPLSENTKKMYSKNDEDGRGKYRLYPLQKTSSPGPETTYDYVDENGKVWKCPRKGWRMNKQKMKKLELDGRLYLEGNSLAEKAYWNERDNEGRLANNLWDDVYNIQGSNIEATNFVGGQKPEKLIERIILLGTDENDIVLDYHLGSGTTAAVAHKMGRQYIGIEQMDYVETIAVERLKKVIGQSTSPAKAGTTQKENFRKLTAKKRQSLQDILEKIKNSNNSLG
jgi:adenine-specific DNA-methyltransferase